MSALEGSTSWQLTRHPSELRSSLTWVPTLPVPTTRNLFPLCPPSRILAASTALPTTPCAVDLLASIVLSSEAST